jgi:hypothetical protein
VVGRRKVQTAGEIGPADFPDEVGVATHHELIAGTVQADVEAFAGAFERRADSHLIMFDFSMAGSRNDRPPADLIRGQGMSVTRSHPEHYVDTAEQSLLRWCGSPWRVHAVIGLSPVLLSHWCAMVERGQGRDSKCLTTKIAGSCP